MKHPGILYFFNTKLKTQEINNNCSIGNQAFTTSKSRTLRAGFRRNECLVA